LIRAASRTTYPAMLYNILLAFMILVCILMVLVILAQRSEGGALGIGGGTGGFMTARGAGNFLTRTTWILAGLFFVCAVVLILVNNIERHNAAFENLKIAPVAPRAALAPAPQRPAAAPAAQPAAPPAATTSAPDLGDLEAPAAQAGHPAAQSSSPAKPASK
jgi:preprotein translocase subunit SecG